MNEKFLSRFFKVYIILVLQNVVTLSVNLLDNIMLGSYSEVALSGVATINQVQFVYQQVLTALGDGIVILCSQYYGKKDLKSMKKIQVTALYIAVIIALLFFVAVTFFPNEIIGVFTEDININYEATNYLMIIRFTYLFFAISTILLATLKSVEIVKIGFQLSILALIVNGLCNYTLIYGRFGFPEMGVRGAAIGTLIARICEMSVCIWFVFFKDKMLKFKLKDFFMVDAHLAKDYIRIVTPMMIVQSSWGISTALQTSILGHISARAIAANSVASTLFLMTKSAAVGASSAAALFMGQLVGLGDENKTKEYGYRLQKIFILIGIIGGIILFLIRVPILSFYQLSSETKELANAFLIVLSVIFVTMSYQMPTNAGIIRGAGDSMFGVKMDFISTWFIVIPLSAIMAFVVKAPPLVVLICLNSDQVFKCIPVYFKMKKGNWIKSLTRN